MSRSDILAQNASSVAPEEIIDALVILEVDYWGYDAAIHHGQIVVHKRVANDVRQFFECAYDLKFPIEKVIPISNQKYRWDDETSCEDNNSSGYNYRTILGTSKLSYHAKGCAFDINPEQNIYVRYDDKGNEIFRSPKKGTYDPYVKGTLTKDHPLVLVMKEKGWVWGGDWSKEEGRVDYQHFEKHID